MSGTVYVSVSNGRAPATRTESTLLATEKAGGDVCMLFFQSLGRRYLGINLPKSDCHTSLKYRPSTGKLLKPKGKILFV